MIHPPISIKSNAVSTVKIIFMRQYFERDILALLVVDENRGVLFNECVKQTANCATCFFMTE